MAYTGGGGVTNARGPSPSQQHAGGLQHANLSYTTT